MTRRERDGLVALKKAQKKLMLRAAGGRGIAAERTPVK